MYHKQLIRPVIKAWVKRIYNKKPMSLRKGIGFCQQSESSRNTAFYVSKLLEIHIMIVKKCKKSPKMCK